jgi:hypothetical protein
MFPSVGHLKLNLTIWTLIDWSVTVFSENILIYDNISNMVITGIMVSGEKAIQPLETRSVNRSLDISFSHVVYFIGGEWTQGLR